MRHTEICTTMGAALLLAASLSDVPAAETMAEREMGDRAAAPRLTYRVTATEARLNRRVIGPVKRWLQGVAAEPVDSFVWDGEGSVPIEGTLSLEISPVSNTGWIKAEWTDANGKWVYEQDRFLHPDEHPSGVRIGSSVFGVDSILNEAVSHNVYLHGDTGSGMPVLPTVFTYLAAWGPSDVTLDGERFENPFEIPAPQWLGHLMVTEGARRADGTVRTLTGEIYDPSMARDGAVEPGDLEVHLVFHDDVFPMTENVPPIFSFFYHLLFEEVAIEIVHDDPPVRPEPPIVPSGRRSR